VVVASRCEAKSRCNLRTAERAERLWVQAWKSAKRRYPGNESAGAGTQAGIAGSGGSRRAGVPEPVFSAETQAVQNRRTYDQSRGRQAGGREQENEICR